VGANVTLADGSSLTLLCDSQKGYRNLCKLLTAAHLGNPRETPCASWESIEEHAGGLFALSRQEEQLDRVAAIFPRAAAIELQRHHLPDEERLNQRLVACARKLRLPLVATADARYATDRDRRLYDAMVCIRHLCTIDEAGRRLLPNGEFRLKSPPEMAELFRDLPEAITNAYEIGERCAFSLDDLGYRFPPYPVPSGSDENAHLRKLAFEGGRRRYGDPLPEKALEQLEHELTLIAKLELAGYFLIVWDIVEYARTRGILVQGRGSAANSAVCYALGITAVDPVGMELLFERFLSEARGEWPDIDLDLPSGDPREDVIQYVYRRYGRHGAAMTAEVITWRGRSSVRDLGKVLGLPEGPIDRLAKLLSPFEFTDDADTISAQMAEAGFDPGSPRVRLLGELAMAIEGLPRHIGQHSGGMVVTAGRLDEVVPLEPAAMPGRVIVQWDKDDCADMKIVKVDLLGLGMMAVLADCVGLAREAHGIELDYAKLPAGDPDVYAMLQRADTIGVFQVESRAQMSCLPRLRPKCFYDIVVEVALIRPGPIQGQSVHPYLNRRAGREEVTYAHPCLEPILKRTLGVPLFQEQGMRIAMVAAGFSAAEAEELRRAMGHKRSRKRMAEMKDRLMSGMRERGVAQAACDRIWQQLMAFADYGFPESHSASFALIVYASTYLKAHHHAVFTCAMLNNWPLGFYHPSTLIKDAERHGVVVLPPDVTRSGWLCTLEDGALRIGLRYVEGLPEALGKRIEAERARARFTSLEDFARRVPTRKRDLEALAGAGASRGFALERREALWRASALLSAGPLDAPPLPEPSPLEEMTARERQHADYELLGLTCGPHPMALERGELARAGVVRACDLEKLRDGQTVRVGGVAIVRQRPGTAKGFFFLTLEDETGLVNIIVTPKKYAEGRATLVSAPALVIEGRLQKQDGTIAVRGLHFFAWQGGGPQVSRDFH
jgi:error-prone DNA polymerase